MNIGDLIQVREAIPFGPPVGAVGIVDFTQVQSVCIKGGLVGRSPEDGGPVHAEEKCVVAMFGDRRQRITYYSHYDIVGKA
mgnify:FL=1